jgi:hypothetical protein
VYFPSVFLSFQMVPQIKTEHINSGDCGGHSTGPHLPIQCWMNCSSGHVLMILWFQTYGTIMQRWAHFLSCKYKWGVRIGCNIRLLIHKLSVIYFTWGEIQFPCFCGSKRSMFGCKNRQGNSIETMHSIKDMLMSPSNMMFIKTIACLVHGCLWWGQGWVWQVTRCIWYYYFP